MSKTIPAAESVAPRESVMVPVPEKALVVITERTQYLASLRTEYTRAEEALSTFCQGVVVGACLAPDGWVLSGVENGSFVFTFPE